MSMSQPNVTANATLDHLWTDDPNFQQLKASLGLNIKIAIVGILLFLYLRWHRQDPSRMSAEQRKKTTIMEPLLRMDALRANAASRNYLEFLLVCRAMSVVIFIFNLLFLLKAGPDSMVDLVFLGRSTMTTMDKLSVYDLGTIVSVIGTVVLIGSCILQTLTEQPPPISENLNDQIQRTVWFQALPNKDAMTGKLFSLGGNDLMHVQHDLAKAISEHVFKRFEGTWMSTIHKTLLCTITEQKIVWQDGQTHYHVTELDRMETDFYYQGTHYKRCTSKTIMKETKLFWEESGDVWRRPKRTWKGTMPLLQRIKHTDTESFVDKTKEELLDWLAHKDEHTLRKAVQSIADKVPAISEGPIEKVTVAVIADDWLQAKQEMDNAHNQVVKWRTRLNEPEWTNCFGCKRRYAEKKSQHHLEAAQSNYEIKKHKLEDMQNDKRQMTGSAFVTFSHRAWHDIMLTTRRKDVDLRDWLYYLLFSENLFRFGRPPFSSVTLVCRRAVHPDEINWENLHIGRVDRWARLIGACVLLFIIMFILVTADQMMSIIKPLLDGLQFITKDLETQKLPGEPQFVADIAAYIDSHNIIVGVQSQLPPYLMLIINSLLLPFFIDWIARAERGHMKEKIETRNLDLNFIFMVLNTLAVPFLNCGSVAALVSLLEPHIQTKLIKSETEAQKIVDLLQSGVSTFTGIFVLKYLLSATFLSSILEITQIPQIITQKIFLASAVTAKERADAIVPWDFAWGYWYAWGLSLFTLGFAVCPLLPSTALVMAMLFWFRYYVEKYAFENKLLAVGKFYAGRSVDIRVVTYLRFIVGSYWCVSGFCGIFIDHLFGELPANEVSDCYYGGCALMILGSLTNSISWGIRKRILHIQRVDPNFEESPTQFPRFRFYLTKLFGLTDNAQQEHAFDERLEDEKILSWDPREVLNLEAKPATDYIKKLLHQHKFGKTVDLVAKSKTLVGLGVDTPPPLPAPLPMPTVKFNEKAKSTEMSSEID